jgi:hypothetical protein
MLVPALTYDWKSVRSHVQMGIFLVYVVTEGDRRIDAGVLPFR